MRWILKAGGSRFTGGLNVELRTAEQPNEAGSWIAGIRSWGQGKNPGNNGLQTEFQILTCSSQPVLQVKRNPRKAISEIIVEGAPFGNIT